MISVEINDAPHNEKFHFVFREIRDLESTLIDFDENCRNEGKKFRQAAFCFLVSFIQEIFERLFRKEFLRQILRSAFQ